MYLGIGPISQGKCTESMMGQDYPTEQIELLSEISLAILNAS